MQFMTNVRYGDIALLTPYTPKSLAASNILFKRMCIKPHSIQRNLIRSASAAQSGERVRIVLSNQP